MKEEMRILIMYRLERARESLEEAGILLEREYAIPLSIVFIMPVSTPCLPSCLQKGSDQQNIAAFVASFTKTS
jgi:hypothetical protein